MTRATGDATTDRMGIRGQPVYMPPPREFTEPYADEEIGGTEPDHTPRNIISRYPVLALAVGASAGLLLGIGARTVLRSSSGYRGRGGIQAVPGNAELLAGHISEMCSGC